MPKFSVTAVHFFYAGRCMLPRRKTTACLEVPRFHFFFLVCMVALGLLNKACDYFRFQEKKSVKIFFFFFPFWLGLLSKFQFFSSSRWHYVVSVRLQQPRKLVWRSSFSVGPWADPGKASLIYDGALHLSEQRNGYSFPNSNASASLTKPNIPTELLE